MRGNILVSLVIGTLLVFGGLFFAANSYAWGFNICNIFPNLPQCQEPSPTPSPSPSPSPEPEECDEGYVLVEDECVPEEQPSPSPEPVVETQGQPAPTAPVCPDGNTTNVVANLHVLRAGSDATVNFFITEGNNASIFYSVVGQPHWQYAVADVKPNADNFVSYTIHDLDPNLGYDFGAQQRFGCGGGQTTGVVVDGPVTQLFNLTYWE